MARGRMVSKSLSTSEKRAALHDEAGPLAEFCQALYPLLIAHSDDWGCQQGDVFTIKHMVEPTSPRSLDEFRQALIAMHNVELITWYQDGGAREKMVVYIRGWFDHQNLKGHDKRERPFSIPPENPSKIARSAQKCPEVPKRALTKLNLTELNSTELNRTALTRSEDLFASFWSAYPKKKSKADAEKAWRKLAPSPELSQRILASIAAQRGSVDWQKDRGQFIPYPASWLNARRWEDEVERPGAPSMGTRSLALVNATAGFLGGGG